MIPKTLLYDFEFGISIEIPSGKFNVYITNWKIHPFFHGYIPYFYGHFQSHRGKKSTGAAMFRPCDQHRLGPDNHLIRSTWEDEEGGRTETELVASKSSWFAGKKHASSIHEGFKHVFLRVLKNYKLSSHI